MHTLFTGPAPSQFTDKIYEISKTLQEYRICSDLNANISTVGEQQFSVDGKTFIVSVVDGVSDYAEYMKKIFDFEAIKNLFCGEQKINVLVNAMHGGKANIYFDNRHLIIDL